MCLKFYDNGALDSGGAPVIFKKKVSKGQRIFEQLQQINKNTIDIG
jgi:hypothetical protein